MKYLMIVPLICISLTTQYALAAGDGAKRGGDRMHRAHRQVAREWKEGTRERTISVTRADGSIRTRTKSVTVEGEPGNFTRTTSGTNFKGQEYTRQDTILRNDTGLTKESITTGPNGTRSSTLSVVVDKEAGTVTRSISGERANGESFENDRVSTIR